MPEVNKEGKRLIMIDEILGYNKAFVENKNYEKYSTSKYPNKKIAIVTCMDTRLTELLPAALGLKNGDAKIIKNVGGIISHPFGSVMRKHPLVPEEIKVYGLVIDSATGELTKVDTINEALTE